MRGVTNPLQSINPALLCNPSLLSLPGAGDLAGLQDRLQVCEVDHVGNNNLCCFGLEGPFGVAFIFPVQGGDHVVGGVRAEPEDLPVLEAQRRPLLVGDGHVFVDVVVHVEELALLGLGVENCNVGRHFVFAARGGFSLGLVVCSCWAGSYF